MPRKTKGKEEQEEGTNSKQNSSQNTTTVATDDHKKKPLLEWTKADVQNFLNENENFRVIASKFPVNGDGLGGFSEQQLITFAGNEVVGISLSNDIKAIKERDKANANKTDLLEFLTKNAKSDEINIGPPPLTTAELAVPFIGRDDALAHLWDRYLENQVTSNTSKLQNRIPVLASFSGIGKTRLLVEFANYLIKTETSRHVLPLYITYGDGTNVNEMEQDPEFGFALRLLHRYFIASGEPELRKPKQNHPSEFKTWMESIVLGKYSKVTIRKAIRCIIEYEKKRTGTKKSIAFYIAVDEFQNACERCVISEECSKARHPYFRHALLPLLQFTAGGASRYGDYVFPVFAGLDSEALCNAVGASHFPEDIPLDPIDVSLVLQRLFTGEFMKLENEQVFREPLFHQHMALLNGSMRSIVSYLTKINQQFTDARSLKTIFDNLDPLARIGDSAITFELFALAVTQHGVNPEEFKSTIEAGACSVINSKIIIRFSALMALKRPDPGLTANETAIQLAIIQNIKYLTDYVLNFNPGIMEDWKRWEFFGAFFFALKYNCFLWLRRNDKEQEIPFSEFHQGAVISSDLRDRLIRLSNPISVVNLQAAVLAQDSTKVIDTNKTYTVVEKTDILFVSGPNGPAVDSFYIAEMERNENETVNLTNAKPHYTKLIADKSVQLQKTKKEHTNAESLAEKNKNNNKNKKRKNEMMEIEEQLESLENEESLLKIAISNHQEVSGLIDKYAKPKNPCYPWLFADQRRGFPIKLTFENVSDIVVDVVHNSPEWFKFDYLESHARKQETAQEKLERKVQNLNNIKSSCVRIAVGIFSNRFPIDVDQDEWSKISNCYYVGSKEIPYYYGTSFSFLALLSPFVYFGNPSVNASRMVSCILHLTDKTAMKVAREIIALRESVEQSKQAIESVVTQDACEKILFKYRSKQSNRTPPKFTPNVVWSTSDYLMPRPQEKEEKEEKEPEDTQPKTKKQKHHQQKQKNQKKEVQPQTKKSKNQ